MRHHVWIGLVLLSLGLASGCNSSGTPESAASSKPQKIEVQLGEAPGAAKPNEKPPEIPVPQEPAYTGTLNILRAEYVVDQTKGNETYRGKWVEISGKIMQSGVDYIEMARDDGKLGVAAHCEFDPQQGYDAINSLSGRPVKILGKFDRFAFDVLFLKHCQVVELGENPRPLVSVTVDEISQAYQDDFAAAEKKYSRDTLRLEGFVVKQEKSKLLLRGADEKTPHYASCTFPIGDPDLKDLKEGTPVKVIGSSAEFWEVDQFKEEGKMVSLSYCRMWKELPQSEEK